MLPSTTPNPTSCLCRRCCRSAPRMPPASCFKRGLPQVSRSVPPHWQGERRGGYARVDLGLRLHSTTALAYPPARIRASRGFETRRARVVSAAPPPLTRASIAPRHRFRCDSIGGCAASHGCPEHWALRGLCPQSGAAPRGACPQNRRLCADAARGRSFDASIVVGAARLQEFFAKSDPLATNLRDRLRQLHEYGER